jgi:hypothetical protein
MRERRQIKRQPTRHRLNVRDADTGRILGRLVDITVCGLLLVSSRPLAAAERFRLRIPLPILVQGRGEIEITAESVWTEPDRNPRYHRIGFRIPDVGGVEAYAIETILSRLYLVN